MERDEAVSFDETASFVFFFYQLILFHANFLDYRRKKLRFKLQIMEIRFLNLLNL